MESSIQITDKIKLELIAPIHAAGLLDAVNQNRDHLAAFLPWVGFMKTVGNFENYIQNCMQLYKEGTEVNYVIFYQGTMVGRIGLHQIDTQNKNASLGYWLSKQAVGQGIITQCCNTLIHLGFGNLALHRIEIRVATHNQRSEAIPIRMGFTKEGVLKQAESVNNQFFDIAIYSLINPEA